MRYSDRTENIGAGETVFCARGHCAHLQRLSTARYLIILAPRLSALIAALQADRELGHQHEIYRRFDFDLLE